MSIVPQSDTADRSSRWPHGIVVMGVSGSGKSTLGSMLARVLDCPFLEGDAFHSSANVTKMGAGQALDDVDRWPWLDQLGVALGEAVRMNGTGVLACSALKRSYRTRLAQAAEVPVAFVLLDTDPEELRRRLRDRPDHYMPPSLLASQLATLERPEADEPALACDAHLPPDEIIGRIEAWLGKIARG